MASLLPSDVIVPTPIAQYVGALICEKSAFIASAAAGADLDAGAQLGGVFYTKAQWEEDLTADEKIDGSSSTPGKVQSFADVAPVLRRKRVRGIVDGSNAVIGRLAEETPDAAVMNQAAAYWARRVDAAFVSTLSGLFSASGGPCLAGNSKDVSRTAAPAVPASFSYLVDAGAMVGDSFTDLAVMVCHSKVWADLTKEAGQKVTWDVFGDSRRFFYDGKRVIVSDNVPTSGSSTYKKYWTFLLSPGSLYFAAQQAMREIVQVDAKVPETIYTQTMHFACAARGCKWNVSTENPANSELATYTNWALRSSETNIAKIVGIAALISNAS